MARCVLTGAYCCGALVARVLQGLSKIRSCNAPEAERRARRGAQSTVRQQQWSQTQRAQSPTLLPCENASRNEVRCPFCSGVRPISAIDHSPIRVAADTDHQRTRRQLPAPLFNNMQHVKHSVNCMYANMDPDERYSARRQAEDQRTYQENVIVGKEYR